MLIIYQDATEVDNHKSLAITSTQTGEQKKQEPHGHVFFFRRGKARWAWPPLVSARSSAWPPAGCPGWRRAAAWSGGLDQKATAPFRRRWLFSQKELHPSLVLEEPTKKWGGQKKTCCSSKTRLCFGTRFFVGFRRSRSLVRIGFRPSEIIMKLQICRSWLPWWKSYCRLCPKRAWSGFLTGRAPTLGGSAAAPPDRWTGRAPKGPGLRLRRRGT